MALEEQLRAGALQKYTCEREKQGTQHIKRQSYTSGSFFKEQKKILICMAQTALSCPLLS